MRIISTLRDDEIQEELRENVDLSDGLQAVKWQKLLELVEHLRADGPYPVAFAIISDDELLLLPSRSVDKVSVKIDIAWPDYSPLNDGLPPMHYRLLIRRETGRLSQDARLARRLRGRASHSRGVRLVAIGAVSMPHRE